jgi:Rha family phage regulatory protein
MTEASDMVVYSGSRLITTSLKISQYFGRDHKSVLRAIENLECSEEFNRRNFALVGYSDGKGEARPSYDITRDGFTFLAMGFTGAEAAKWKERYIHAFNKIEAELLAQRLAGAQDAQILRKQLDACTRRLLRVDKGAQSIIRLAGIADLSHAERAKFAHMSIDRYRKEAAELMQMGLIDRPPVNQRMVEMAKKGRAVQLAKKAAQLAGMAKDVAQEASSNVSPDASDARA